ncbi:Protein of unknown function [Limimonas halophila]|uniref:DUF3108 domain-containing protein n=1 Tax=Limimonas halophila TaxID=1082479 RepID=A0A1G7QRI5_9PROT|nr:DUF3108 domain-containing protein [Limimonas halophila]SDG01146.1 Protein of unknown function [Limimonas halophila]
MPGTLRGLCAAPLMAALLATPATAEQVGLTYKLWVGGLHGLTMKARVELDANRYDLALQAQTKGWTSTLFPFVLEARSVGAVDGELPDPGRFHTASREGSERIRWAALDYPAGDGAPTLKAWPDPADERDREVVPERARRATLDPVSAVYTLLRQAADGCDGKVAIFDGRRRFNLIAQDQGTKQIRKSAYTMYSGPARVCELTLRRVHGFEQDNGRNRGKGGSGGGGESKYPDTIRVFLAEVKEGLPPLPVRLEAVTLLGALRAHLVTMNDGDAAQLSARKLLPLADHTDAEVPPIQDGG